MLSKPPLTDLTFLAFCTTSLDTVVSLEQLVAHVAVVTAFSSTQLLVFRHVNLTSQQRLLTQGLLYTQKLTELPVSLYTVVCNDVNKARLTLLLQDQESNTKTAQKWFQDASRSRPRTKDNNTGMMINSTLKI